MYTSDIFFIDAFSAHRPPFTMITI